MRKEQSVELKKKYITALRLDDAFPDEVLPLTELHVFDKGEYVCRSGERIEYFHIIMDGTCKVIPTSETGKEVLLSYLEPMGFIGDIELFNECEALHSVLAATQVVAIAISRKVFFNEMMCSPPFLQMLCRNFATKIYVSSQQHSSNMLYSIKNRLSRFLLTAVEEQQTDAVRIKRSEVAQLLGISGRHLRRVLSSYEKDGIIQRKGERIIILDLAVLREQSSCF